MVPLVFGLSSVSSVCVMVMKTVPSSLSRSVITDAVATNVSLVGRGGLSHRANSVDSSESSCLVSGSLCSSVNGQNSYMMYFPLCTVYTTCPSRRITLRFPHHVRCLSLPNTHTLSPCRLYLSTLTLPAVVYLSHSPTWLCLPLREVYVRNVTWYK